MTSRADAVRAAAVYKETQPTLDAVKAAASANKAAREILGDYMLEKHRDVFYGITLTCTNFEQWDNDMLNAFLGERRAEFRKSSVRKSFGLSRRT